MQVFQSLAVLSYFLFSDFFVDGACYFFDESELEEVLEYVETFLEDVLFLGIVVVVFFAFFEGWVLFLAIHFIK